MSITPTLKPHHYGISVKNYAETLAWYSEHLGFELRSETYVESVGLRIGYIAREGFEIEVFDQTQSASVPEVDRSVMESFKTQGYKHFAFWVQNCDEVWAEIEKRGLDLLTPPTTNTDLGVRYCFIRDLNGIQIEFLHRI